MPSRVTRASMYGSLGTSPEISGPIPCLLLDHLKVLDSKEEGVIVTGLVPKSGTYAQQS